MGADRAVLVSDDGAAGSDLVATSRVLGEGARARGRRSRALRPAVVRLQAPSSGPRSPSACACRSSRRPRARVADGKATAKRETEYGYDVIEAPLPGRGRRVGRDQ